MVQAVPFHLMISEASPTAQTLVALKPEIALRLVVTPEVWGVQEVPSQKRTVPPSPTAQTEEVEVP